MLKELEAFYREPDPAKRCELLEEIKKEKGEEGSEAAAAICLAEEVFMLRYGKPHGKADAGDCFVAQILSLMTITRAPSFFFFSQKKQVERIMRKLGAEAAGKAVSAGYLTRGEADEILYREYYSAASTYFETCRCDDYHKLFGMASSSEEERSGAMAQDAKDMSAAVAASFEMEEEMAVWCRAVDDAYQDQVRKASGYKE